MQNKTLLAKIVGLIAVVCLALAMTFGLVACGDPTVKSVSQKDNVITVELTDGTTSEIKLDGVKDAKTENGKLILTYADGKTANFALGKATISDPTVNNDGNTEIVVTFADGTSTTIVLNKVVKDAAFDGDTFTITYTDGTTAEYALSTVVDVEVLENGQTQITYADGTEAVIGDAACDHWFTASADVKPASCSEKGVKIQVCEKCGYVESIEVEKDPDVHGEWVFYWEIDHGELQQEVNEDEGIIYYSREDDGWAAYRLVTHYICGSMTILEGYSGVGDNCFEAECALCGEQFAAGHADVEDWIDIVLDDSTVNICENEHTVYKTCPICKSVLLYDDNGDIVAKKEAALGHTYGAPEIGDKIGQGDNAYYVVTLTCSRCHESQTVRGYFDSADENEEEVFADCRNNGYYHYHYKPTYKYSYENYVNGVKQVLTDTFRCYDEDVVINEVYQSTGEHVVADGITYHAYDLANPVNEEYLPELKELFDAGLLRWNEGTPANCESYINAVFNCTVCKEVIVISLSGEHTFGAVIDEDATCTEDGITYRVCIDCGYEYIMEEEAATGHNFKYRSFDATSGFARFICTKCGEIVEEEVELVSEHAAADCRSKSYKIFQADLFTGIYDEDEEEVIQTVTFKIEIDEEIMYHTVKANTADTQYMKFAAYNIANQGPNYEYNEQIDGFFTDNLMRWSEGIPANCSSYCPAVFHCTVCDKDIVIALSGEHQNLDQNDTRIKEPTCTEYGYREVKCLDCYNPEDDNYVLQETYDAVGHNFVANEDDWADFIDAGRGERDYLSIDFECTDCEEVIPMYVRETITPNTVGCVTTDIYRYDFYVMADDSAAYTYQVEAAESTPDHIVYKTLTFKAVSYFEYETIGTHLVGEYDDHEIRVVAFNLSIPVEDNKKYEYGEGFGYFFDNEEVAWNEGKPATCENYALAVFECVTCHEKVVFLLSGEHTPGAEIVEQPDCLNAGRRYKVCQVCQTEVDEVEIPALGHNYGAWTLVGDRWVVAAEEDGEVYIDDYSFGYAKSVCTRCGDTLYAEPDDENVITYVRPTCGKDGKVVVGYYFGEDLVATDTIVIPMIDHHITTLESAKHVIKWFDDGKYYLGYVCEGCGDLITVAKSADEAVIDDIIAELTADYVDELLGRA